MSNKQFYFLRAAAYLLLSLLVVAELSAQNIFIDANGVSFQMVPVEGGSFMMGAQRTNPSGQNYDPTANSDESPVHQVTLSSYFMGQTEVTQGLWEAVMGNRPSYFINDEKPVENVSWNDCQEFVAALNELTGFTFRLPTEAEWEFAARGGNLSHGFLYPGGDDPYYLAWYFGISSWTTHEVGTKLPNELGLYDMGGNVWEWCNDWYGTYPSDTQFDPQGAVGDSARVARGGSWMDQKELCRVTPRACYQPQDGGPFLGLRLAADENFLALKETGGRLGMLVYPNPTVSILNVVTNDRIAHCQLLDLRGAVLMDFVPTDCRFNVDLSSLSEGIYLLRGTTADGKQHYQKVTVTR